MKYIKHFLFFNLMLLACNNHNKAIKVMDSTRCGTIDTARFFALINTNWPSRKPNSIVDAVRLLDTLADDNFRCAIVKMDDNALYFNLGLKIRNTWVRHGTDSIKNQFFQKLQLSSPDYTSGLVISIYRECLQNMNVDLVAKFLKKKNDSSTQIIKKELILIQNELSSRKISY